jgi:hypothetical protein
LTNRNKILPFLYPPPPAPPEPSAILPYDSEEFGLTQDEYEILLDDIEQAIDEANRKYGFGGAGYLAPDGNYYLPQPGDAPPYVDHTRNSRKSKSKRPSPEEVAIEKGLVKVWKEDS